MINIGKEWHWMDSNIKTNNDMELGKKIRRLYLREVATSAEDATDDYNSVPTVDKPITSIED